MDKELKRKPMGITIEGRQAKVCLHRLKNCATVTTEHFHPREMRFADAIDLLPGITVEKVTRLSENGQSLRIWCWLETKTAFEQLVEKLPELMDEYLRLPEEVPA